VICKHKTDFTEIYTSLFSDYIKETEGTTELHHHPICFVMKQDLCECCI